jgi:hypothetical protein
MVVRSTPDGSLPRDRINIVSIVSNSVGSEVFIGGIKQLSTSQKNHHYEILDEFYIGRKRADEKERWYRGDIYEFFVFNSALSLSDRAVVENYLNVKYLNQNHVSFFPEIVI